MRSSRSTRRRETGNLPDPPEPALDEEDFHAVSVRVADGRITVVLDDGREASAPIDRFPFLATATAEERQRYFLFGDGTGIEFPDLEDFISVFSIVHPELTMTGRVIPELRRRR